jgi:peptide/nickel transport system substrate-binding protein
VHAGLVGLHPDTLEPVPLAAERLDFLDERTLAVRLRSGLRFHGGKPLTASDVCETLTALADPALRSPHRAVVRAIGSCTPQSDLELVVRVREPRATLLTDLEVPILRADQARLPPQPSGTLDGIGPYRVARAAAGELLLEPATTGLLPTPAHAVLVRTVRDENARALRLLAGRADIAPNALSPALLPALEGREALVVSSRPGANVTYLLMHNERAPFHRPEVRHAVARAIDREAIVRTLLAGRGQVASWLLPPGHWASVAEQAPLPYDPRAARAVLHDLAPVTLLTSTDRARVTIARTIAQMLGDAGLATRVVSLDLGVLLERLDAGDYTLATLQMPELTEPNVLRWFLHPRGVPGEGGEGRNRARWRSQRAGELFDEAATLADRSLRRERYAELAELMRREMPVVPLWHEDQVAVLSERARNFELSAEGRWSALAALGR